MRCTRDQGASLISVGRPASGCAHHADGGGRNWRRRDRTPGVSQSRDLTVTNCIRLAPDRHEIAMFDRHGARMMEQTSAPPVSDVAIAIRSEPPGLVLLVRGSLDPSASELLREVVRAAIVAVGRAARIHLDLSLVSPAPERLPRLVRRLEGAGVVVTPPRLDFPNPHRADERSHLAPGAHE